MRERGAAEEKSFLFACAVVDLARELRKLHEYEIGSQVLRSGTSIGANVREAQRAESKKDFVHKIGIALKEADETKFWLELIDVKVLKVHEQLMNDCEELLRLLAKIRQTAKANS